MVLAKFFPVFVFRTGYCTNWTDNGRFRINYSLHRIDLVHFPLDYPHFWID